MIKIISLDNGRVEYTSFKFSGGEISVKITDTTKLVGDLTIFAPIKNSDDLMELLMVTDAIRQVDPDIGINVTIPYLPYARQDRVMVRGEAMSLKVFANIINAQNYKKVFVWDAHSDVGVALIDRCVNIPQEQLLGIVGKFHTPFSSVEDTILVSPDAGAEKKIYKFAKALGFNEIIFASKVRDVSNGKIIDTKLNNLPERFKYDMSTKDFLIADDICDGGGTFIALAEKLRPLTTGKIKLLVTHGIFSKGVEVFDGIIDEVIVLNNINNVVSTEKTKVIG